MNAMGSYATVKEKLFQKLGRVDALKDFADMMVCKAMAAAWEASAIGTPDDVRRDFLATVRFCHQLADEAESALTAQKAAATAEREGGFR